MTNQAAQTMPELPEPWTIRYHDDATGREIGPPTPLYTADQMHQYARDYAAALAQTAGADVMTHFCNAIDNLNDMPVSEEWAKKWTAKAEFLIGMGPDPGAVSMSDTGDQLLAAAPAASGVDTSTNEVWAARAQEKIEAMDAASGGEGRLTRAEAITEFRSRTAASVSERARELVKRWRECAKSAANGPMFDGASEYAVAGTYIDCADKLESLISGGSHA